MHHINKKAFDQGFKDFQNGVLSNPFPPVGWNDKEWERGQNLAFKLYYDRAVQREIYKKQLEGK